MHVLYMKQLADDRIAELRADTRRARHQPVRRARRADEASQAPARRNWRVLVHTLLAR
jgi:hypothetical protein